MPYRTTRRTAEAPILALTLSCTVAWLKGLKTHWLS